MNVEIYYYLEQRNISRDGQVSWSPCTWYNDVKEFKSEDEALEFIESQTPYFNGWHFKIEKAYRVGI